MQSKGYAAITANTPLEHFEFERKEPRAHEVLIEISHCGICHSDIHQARDEWGGSIFPMVPGHEIVGKVTELGSSVNKFKVGDYVGVGCMIGSCRECEPCKEDLEQFCDKGLIGTYNSLSEDGKTPNQGGYSDKIVVDQDFVLKIPENLDPAGTAPLLCAGITTYSPLKQLKVGSHSKVGVIGLGGLGHMAVKMAASMGAEVTVFSRSDKKKNDAEKLGATNFVVSSDENQMSSFSKKLDVIIDTVSAKHDVAAHMNTLKREGTLVLVGLPDVPLDLPAFPLIINRRRLMGSLIGGIKETQEMLDHCGKHNMLSEIELIKPEQINEAYDRTVKGDVRYRFVIDCQSF